MHLVGVLFIATVLTFIRFPLAFKRRFVEVERIFYRNDKGAT